MIHVWLWIVLAYEIYQGILYFEYMESNHPHMYGMTGRIPDV